MKKLYKTLLSCLCMTAIITMSGTTNIQANTTDQTLEPLRVYGPITKTENETLSIYNNSGTSFEGEIRVTISEQTRILDAVSGLPVAYSDLRDGETAYLYIGPAMGMSLPPVAHATMILCNIPADYKVPEYLKVDSLSLQADGTSGTLTAVNGSQYTIKSDTQILPYLTRNIVTINDLTKGRTCLLWSDSQNQATKIVIFQEDSDNTAKTGWVQVDEGWHYYQEDGTLFTGWLLDNGDWYYLNPSDRIMQTGFLTLDGKTYYLQDNGKMLTKAKSFTPDEKGVLH